jgi:alkylation response protein AidB-like acyl-CoA dehydrogenase
MNFDFTAEQYELRDTIRSYLDDHWSFAQLRAAIDGPGLPDTVWEGLAALGATTMLVPEEQRGLGLTLTDASLVFEAFGETLTPMIVGETLLASDIIARFGSEAQKAALLPAIAEGRLKVALALQDAGTSYDPGRTTTTAAGGADEGWRLEGRKMMVPFGHMADRVLVAARAGAQGGLALFIVDPALPGVTVTPHVLVDPTSRMSTLDFSAALVPGDAMLGLADGAAADHAVRVGAAAAAAQLTGAAGRALEMTLDYAKQRKQFGRAIGSFQAIKHKLADMMVNYETSRSAVYYAHWAVAQQDPGAHAAVSMAKAYAGSMARAVLNESVHIHGGIGFTWEYDLHFLLKRGKVLEYSFGDADWHREQYARAVIDS